MFQTYYADIATIKDFNFDLAERFIPLVLNLNSRPGSYLT